MAEFHGIFCCHFLTSVLLIKEMGGMGGGARWSGVGGGKNLCLGHPMSSHDTHTVALVGHRVSGSKPRFPLSNWCPPLVPLL